MSLESFRQAYVEACAQRTDRPLAILVPCFRAETFIVETLQAIQSQDGLESHVWAVVLAPDCSPDQVIAVARQSWTSTVPLLVDEREQNVGEMRNVNTAVSNFPAHVQWFLNMHGDNIAKPGWLLEVANRHASAPPRAGLIATSYDDLKMDGSIVPGDEQPDVAPSWIEGSPDAVRHTLTTGCWWHNSTGGIRVAAFREVGGLPLGMRQKGDWRLLLKLLDAGWGVLYVPRTRMLYRDNTLSVSSANFQTHLDVRETVETFRLFGHHATPPVRRRFRWTYLRILARRTAASLLRGQFRRAWAAVRLLPELLK